MDRLLKLYLVGKDKRNIGGGFSFISNIQKALKDKVEFIDDIMESDVILISSCTLIDREALKLARGAGKKIILRIDNLPKQSLNRNTAYGSLRLSAELSDAIIYQSEWAKEYVGWFIKDLKKPEYVILNGCDTSIFKPEGEKMEKTTNTSYLYVGRKGEENKRFPEVAYIFHQEFRKDPNIELWLVGSFNHELIEYNFDFVAGEKVKYLGTIDSPEKMAIIYRGADYLLYTYYNDAASNVLVEAFCSGCGVQWEKENNKKILLDNTEVLTGGAKEIVSHFKEEYPKLFGEYKGFFSLERMGNDYLKVIKNI